MYWYPDLSITSLITETILQEDLSRPETLTILIMRMIMTAETWYSLLNIGIIRVDLILLTFNSDSKKLKLKIENNEKYIF